MIFLLFRRDHLNKEKFLKLIKRDSSLLVDGWDDCEKGFVTAGTTSVSVFSALKINITATRVQDDTILRRQYIYILISLIFKYHSVSLNYQISYIKHTGVHI